MPPTPPSPFGLSLRQQCDVEIQAKFEDYLDVAAPFLAAMQRGFGEGEFERLMFPMAHGFGAVVRAIRGANDFGLGFDPAAFASTAEEQRLLRELHGHALPGGSEGSDAANGYVKLFRLTTDAIHSRLPTSVNRE